MSKYVPVDAHYQLCDKCDGQGGHGSGYETGRAHRDPPSMCGWCDGRGYNKTIGQSPHELLDEAMSKLINSIGVPAEIYNASLQPGPRRIVE